MEIIDSCVIWRSGFYVMETWWSSVGLCVEVVCVSGREVSDIDGLPRPPRHLLTQWLSHNTRRASYLVRLFDTCHSW